MLIAVIGGSQCSPEEARIAEAVGRELAKRGAILICGGLAGVMEAACKGARAEGGVTIGILPGNDRSEANPYVQIPIVTDMSYARNVIVAKSAQAVIAIDGEYGTLSEIAYALQSNIPVVGLNTWSLSMKGRVNSSIIPAQNAVEAVEKAIAAAEAREKHNKL
jgi:uncharacterized protein (TIGR00725 family)